MERVLLLVEMVRPRKYKGGRLRVDSIDLRAMIFAARIQGEYVRHSKRTWKLSDEKKAVRFGLDKLSMHRQHLRTGSTIRTLERHSKRADRQLLKKLTREEFATLMRMWRRHLRWMRLYLVYLKPGIPVTPRSGPTLRQRERAVIDRLVALARRALTEKGLQPPPEKRLRQLMRQRARTMRAWGARPEEVASNYEKFGGYWRLGEYVAAHTGRQGGTPS